MKTPDCPICKNNQRVVKADITGQEWECNNFTNHVPIGGYFFDVTKTEKELVHLITLIAQADTGGKLQKTERGWILVMAAKNLTSSHRFFDYWDTTDPCSHCGRDMNVVGRKCGGQGILCTRCAGQRRKE